MQNDINSLFEKTLSKTGYTPQQSADTLVKLNQQMNLAILDAFRDALTPEEQDKLLASFDTIDATNAEAVTKLLTDVCNNSVNKLNPDEVANKARIKVINAFWEDIFAKATPEQKEVLTNELNLTISQNPDLAKVAENMVQYQQQL